MSSDFRLIAATHRDRAAETRKGAFREDLFFRIAVFDLDVPHLRDRGEDIPLLAQGFLDEFSEGQESRKLLGGETAELLAAYHWSGNVRELRNVMERAVVLAGDNAITPAELPLWIRVDESQATATRDSIGASASDEGGGNVAATSAPLTFTAGKARSALGEVPVMNLEELERLVIEQAVRDETRNLSEVCRVLGISRNTLYRKLKKYKLRSPKANCLLAGVRLRDRPCNSDTSVTK